MGLGNIQKTWLLYFSIKKKAYNKSKHQATEETSDVPCKKNYKNKTFQ